MLHHELIYRHLLLQHRLTTYPFVFIIFCLQYFLSPGSENFPCDPVAHCNNTEPGFKCSCPTGYRGNGFYCHGEFHFKYKNLMKNERIIKFMMVQRPPWWPMGKLGRRTDVTWRLLLKYCSHIFIFFFQSETQSDSQMGEIQKHHNRVQSTKRDDIINSLHEDQNRHFLPQITKNILTSTLFLTHRKSKCVPYHSKLSYFLFLLFFPQTLMSVRRAWTRATRTRSAATGKFHNLSVKIITFLKF